MNETTVIRLPLRSPLDPSGTLQLDRWFGAETAVSTGGKPVSFQIDVDDPDRPIDDPHLGVMAKAQVKCGKRAIGYVHLHEAWEWVQILVRWWHARCCV